MGFCILAFICVLVVLLGLSLGDLMLLFVSAGIESMKDRVKLSERVLQEI